MGVLVCYDDFSYDVVSNLDLQVLVEKGSIIGYDNSLEWLKVESTSQSSAEPKGAKTRGSSRRQSKSS